MATPYKITGAKGDIDHPRLEIRDLHDNHPEQFSLFVLGWALIRRPDYEPRAAQFVQQGGIHGLPYERWPGDPLASNTLSADGEKRWLGKQSYCNHASVLFPTWHRPSVLLLEQSISEAAHLFADDMARLYPSEGQKWKDAATKLRFPFWDWTDPSTGKEGFPKILYQDHFNIVLPVAHGKNRDNKQYSQNLQPILEQAVSGVILEPGPVPDLPGTTSSRIGVRFEFPNILAFYEFGDTHPDGFKCVDQNPIGEAKEQRAYYGDWKRTYRWPLSDKERPSDRIEQIDKRLKSHDQTPGGEPVRGSWKNLTSKVALLFNFPDSEREVLHANVWDEFSNTRFQSAPLRDKDDGPINKGPHTWGCGSIEHPHNTVHLVLGGLGHMMNNDYASFDPVFFLHHCNIDRILAFWEHVYPDYWMGEHGYLNEQETGRDNFTQIGGKFEVDKSVALKGSSELTPFRKGDGAYWTSDNARGLGPKSYPKHYTYPPIEAPDPSSPSHKIKVVIGEPVDTEERKRQRAALQRHFQHDVVSIREDHRPSIKHVLFSEFDKDPEPGYSKIHQYREFFVSAQVNPYAFGGSYTIEIRYDLGNGHDGFIGTVDVLARPDDTKCAGCQGRRAEGVKAWYIVLVPHRIVVNILKHSSEDKSANAIAKALYSRISYGDDQEIGRSVPHGQPHAAEQSLPADSAPKLQLLSASVQAEIDPLFSDPGVPQGESPKYPYENYDWQDHGALAPHWTKAAGQT